MSAKKPAKGKAKMGRPRVEYTQEKAALFCRLVATQSKSIATICRENDALPGATTIKEWLMDREDFAAQYARAKELQMGLLGEEIIEISDDTSGDTITSEDGTPHANSEWIARSKLRVDTRKWLMSKLAPKKYGDKIGVETSGTVNVVTTHMTRAEFKKRLDEARVNADGK